MAFRSSWLRIRRGAVLGLVLFATAGGGMVAWLAHGRDGREARIEAIDRIVVHRAALNHSVRAGGKIESMKRTMIECQVEALHFSSEGRSFFASERPTILEIVDEGALVKKGQVLCRLDSSDYEELVRQQEIKLEQARNDHYKAELDVKGAEQALQEYREGLLPQDLQELSGQIAMARSELERQQDRLRWAANMVKQGYYSGGSFVADKQRELTAQVALDRLLGQEGLLRKMSGPAALRTLEIQLATTQSSLSYQDVRLRRNEQQMAKFKAQVERCTIVAPHDGTVVYASQNRNNPVTVGTQVFQRMPLFYLPDLGSMEMQATLNEAEVGHVKQAMPASVTVEGLPDFRLEGDVMSVDPMPIVRHDFPAMFSDVKSYMGRIRLRSSPKGLLPGMTAEVQINTGTTENALVIPSESMVVDHGRDYCYVAHSDGLERREIRVGQGNRDMLEVRSGLSEGEEIVRHPSQLDDSDLELATSRTSELRTAPIDEEPETQETD